MVTSIERINCKLQHQTCLTGPSKCADLADLVLLFHVSNLTGYKYSKNCQGLFFDHLCEDFMIFHPPTVTWKKMITIFLLVHILVRKLIIYGIFTISNFNIYNFDEIFQGSKITGKFQFTQIIV